MGKTCLSEGFLKQTLISFVIFTFFLDIGIIDNVFTQGLIRNHCFNQQKHVLRDFQKCCILSMRKEQISGFRDDEFKTNDRRDFMIKSFTAYGLITCAFFPISSEAAALKSGAEAVLEPGVTQEQVSKIASKIPGYGPSDCYFPGFFQGVWQVERELVGINTPLGEDKVEQRSALVAANSMMNKKISYKMRFINYKGNIVADRAFNAKTLGEATTPGKLSSTSWEPENPNILAITYGNGMVKEIKVTKRSFETPSPEAFGTSEYARIAEASMEGPLGSVPELSAIRTLTRFKKVDEKTVEALELVKYYPAVSMTTNPDPFLILKSRLNFIKL